MEYSALLPAGEYYLDVGTGSKSQQLLKQDVPRKVVAFSCGGGSFFEYEQVKALNTEKTGSGQKPGNAAAQGDDPTANGTA